MPVHERGEVEGFRQFWFPPTWNGMQSNLAFHVCSQNGRVACWEGSIASGSRSWLSSFSPAPIEVVLGGMHLVSPTRCKRRKFQEVPKPSASIALSRHLEMDADA